MTRRRKRRTPEQIIRKLREAEAMRSIGAGMLVVLWASATLLAEEVVDKSLANWPQWRGPTFNGVAPLGDPPVQWSATQNLRWKTPIEGRGQSTPIVWGERVFLVTAIPIDKEVPPPYVIPADTPRISGATSGCR